MLKKKAVTCGMAESEENILCTCEVIARREHIVIRTHHDSQDILPNGMADFITRHLRPSGEAAIAIRAPRSKT